MNCYVPETSSFTSETRELETRNVILEDRNAYCCAVPQEPFERLNSQSPKDYYTLCNVALRNFRGERRERDDLCSFLCLNLLLRFVPAWLVELGFFVLSENNTWVINNFYCTFLSTVLRVTGCHLGPAPQ